VISRARNAAAATTPSFDTGCACSVNVRSVPQITTRRSARTVRPVRTRVKTSCSGDWFGASKGMPLVAVAPVKAFHHRSNAALKILRRHDADERQLRHFEREARCAALMNHPNVVTIYDVGRDGEVHYIATEYVEGETLRQRIHRGPMMFTEVVDVGASVAHAL